MEQMYDSRHSGQEVDNAVDAVQTTIPNQLTQIGSKLGDLSELETEEKTNLVDAINEVKNNAKSAASDVSYVDNYGIGADNVQDAIDKVGFVGTDTEIDLSQYTEVRAFITSDSTPRWLTTNNNYPYKGIFIPVVSETSYRITAAQSGTAYAFLVSNEPGTNSSNVTTFADGSTKVSIGAGTTVVDTAPSDAKFMWVWTTASTTGDSAPQKIEAMRQSVGKYLADVDEVPSSGSEKLVKSGGVYSWAQETLNELGVYQEFDEEPNLGAWGRSSSRSAFVDNGGHNVTITAKALTSCRIGFEVTDIGAGKELHISYDFLKTTANSSSWGIGSALGVTWASLTCKTGTAVFPSELSGSMEFSFVIPEGTTYIFIAAADFYDDGNQTLQLTNFKAWTIDGIGRRVEQKTDIEYVDGVRAELENEIELSKYSLSHVEDVWSTNDATVIYAVREGDDVIVTTTSNAAYKRCGFDISSFEIGDKICVSYLSSSNIVWGVGETLGSTFIHVGNYSKTFMFTKTDATQKYLYLAANSYASTGVTLTLTNFKVYRAVTLEDVNTEVENLKSYSFMPSSYIPIKETYERYMTVSAAGAGQGCAVYDNYFVQGFTYTHKIIKIYDLQTKELVQEVSLPAFANARYHSNTISFSGTKYDSADVFPLLYICSGYTDSSSVTTSEVYVVRIAGTEGSFTTELVQTIYLDFGTWTEWVCDPVLNRAWINGSGIDKYICVSIPEITESEVTINTETAILDHFNTKSFTLGTSTKSSGQGRFFYHGRVYYVSGVPDRAEEAEDSLYVVVDNTLTHCTEAVVSLKNYGLAAGASLTYEPEGCFIWNDEFYVAYRTFIVKLIQN